MGDFNSDNLEESQSKERLIDLSPLNEHDVQTNSNARLPVRLDTETASQFPDENALLALLDEPKGAKKDTPLERDNNGRITRINHTDGSYDSIDYDTHGTPIRVTQYSEAGSQKAVIDSRTSDGLSARLRMTEDGTVEKTTLQISEVRGGDIYDRKGNVIGTKFSQISQTIFQESWKPDGSHSISREYPDKSTREFTFKPGEPNKYTYTSATGEQQIWQQEPGTDKWYEAKDTKHERPWIGKSEFHADGRLVNTGPDGNIISELSPEGNITRLPDTNAWKRDVLAIAKARFTDKDVFEQFRTDLEDIQKRVESGELANSEAARTYQQLYRGLTTHSQVGVSDQNLLILTRQIAHEQAHPEDIDQGAWNTCHSEAPRVKLSHTDSSKVAKLQLDAAITGKFTDSRGVTVDVRKSVQPASSTSLGVPPGSNVRSYGGQLFDVVAHNLCLADLNKAIGTQLEYVQGPVRGTDNGARIMDNSQNPPREVYSINGRTPVHVSTPILDDKGVQQLNANLQPKMTSPMEGIDLTIVDSIQIADRIAKKEMTGHAIGHFDQIGQYSNWILAKVGLSGTVQKDWRIPFFQSEADLHKILEEANKTHKFPLLLETNSGGGKLGEQIAAAAGKPLGGEGGIFGGGHILCISQYDPDSQTAFVDNTWGSQRDLRTATLKDIIDMSRQPVSLREQQEQYESDIREAYVQWCREYNKRPGKDYPSTVAGSEYFKRYRREIGHLPAK